MIIFEFLFFGFECPFGDALNDLVSKNFEKSNLIVKMGATLKADKLEKKGGNVNLRKNS